MEYKDYYGILAVDRSATEEQIKAAYRKLARKYHPDMSKLADAETKFKEVGEAYEVLKDPEKRSAYDRLGANWRAGENYAPPPNAGGGFSAGGPHVDPSRFSDFFESLFGGAYRAHGATGGAGFRARGEDQHARIVIDLEDAYRVTTRTLTMHGAEGEHSLNVRIPKGVRRGEQIRLAGQGAPGFGGGEAGDLYLEVDFHPHRLYRVSGADVSLNLPVAPWELALGASVDVPTPSGTVTLKIPAGSNPGRKLRVKGRGIPSKRCGDLYVVLEIALPAATTAAAKKAYEQMKSELDFNPRAGLGI